MGVQLWTELAGAALSGSAIPKTLGIVWRRLTRDPKTEAEARKLNVEAGDLIVARLYAEIERLDRDLGELRQQLTDERRECDLQIQEMEGRIRQLQQQQTSSGRLPRNQVEGPLHVAFPVTIPPDQDADLIDKLHHQPGRRR